MAEIKKETAKGLIVIFTGNGKGKTSAAMGVMTRAAGHGFNVSVLQFLKNPGRVYGEAVSAEKLGVSFDSLGTGFVFRKDQKGEDYEAAITAWEKAKERIQSQPDGVVILDEITYPLNFGWIDTDELIEWLRVNKPPRLHLILTGRNAPEKLIEFADMVTEMKEIKHPFRLQNIPAQKGVDF